MQPLEPNLTLETRMQPLELILMLTSPLNWPTVCLSEIAISPGLLVRVLAFQIDLKCASGKLPSLQVPGMLVIPSDSPTVCPSEIPISLRHLAAA